jgi:serine/threonine-protein kinase
MEPSSRIGKYELEEFLGGGMARVYRARDTVLGRRVALKILTAEGAEDAESKARFLLEARTASNIAHENIISVYDFGEDQGRPFIVMELLEGESLRDALRDGHAGDFRRRMSIALQVARAVGYIHTRKIIHRDIKPENIHVDPSGKVKLMDFGIAKAEGTSLTRAGFTLGTPYYMAPEQVLGQPLTPQADVYSFGVLLFELLSGTKPVTGDAVESIFNQILYEPVNLAPLQALHLPAAVTELIEHCTAKQPAQRPQGLGAVADAIEEILDPPRVATKPQPHAPVPRPKAATPRKPFPAARPEDLPRFLEILPALLRTDMGLMLLAAGVAFVLVMLVYVIASRLIH